MVLTAPVCTREGEKLALSRRVDKHWRLIGWGKIRRGTQIVSSTADSGPISASAIGIRVPNNPEEDAKERSGARDDLDAAAAEADAEAGNSDGDGDDDNDAADKDEQDQDEAEDEN